MNLALRLAEAGQLFPDQEALVFHGQRISYATLNQWVNRFASSLKKLGLTPGERVLIALENCPEFVVSFYAVLSLQCVAVPIDPLYTIHEITYIVRDASPALVICNAENISTFTRLTGNLAIPRGFVVVNPGQPYPHTRSFADLLSSSPAGDLPRPVDRDEVAEILYTSGNTGKPKGVMLTHGNIYSNAVTFARICGFGPGVRTLLVAPVYHSAAQTCVLLASLVAGATVVIHERWPGARTVLQTIQDEKITFFFGPPTMYVFLLEEQSGSFDLGSWKIAFCGGAHLPVQVFYSFEKKFGFQITEGYGLTETSPVVTCNPVFGTKKPGSAGLPIPGVEVKIVDYEGRALPAGQVGEIVVRGPNVMKGYLNQEEETQKAIRNGWLYTGDLGYMDEDGYVFIVGRKKNVIIRGGLNIDPREVEEVLYQHPQIFDAVVVGIPDPVMGEEVAAMILPREQQKPDPEEIKSFCAQRLAPYKVPRKILFMEGLPKTTSGKLLKKEVRKLLEQAQENTPS
ncbi:MAG: long-chain acyl-CoA synthetase [Thermoanaerobacter sp.]|jgi:long-chain acyl-CoA synthetase|uniref:class I adenylate-forming enzyme family protein n=1 Tax=Desulfofundulus thermocisternus TaxID=42471 RepID=UPI0004880098|nr:long-chain fatty acid--CoA ligase [Desulfofundulus thermocisternus]MDK2887703.1 long-chain acyl-CoA synthetase [Thermoanaerobacter sp.]